MFPVRTQSYICQIDPKVVVATDRCVIFRYLPIISSYSIRDYFVERLHWRLVDGLSLINPLWTIVYIATAKWF